MAVYQNTKEAKSALSSAFGPTNDAQRKAISAAAALVPGAQQTSVISPSKSSKSAMLETKSLGISASLPAVNIEDIYRQTENQYLSRRDSMAARFDQKIKGAKEQSAGEQRALEGQMGTGRRFSSSAQAFLKFVGEENNKKIAELEVQKEDALTEFDFKLANLIETKIQNERNNQRALFEDTIKLYEFAEKQNKGAEEAKKAGIQSSRDSAVAGLILQGITDPAELLNTLNFDDAGLQISDFTAEEIGKTLTSLSVSGSSKNLPQDIETFEWLRKNNRLPSGITNLPEEQQYFAYLNSQKLANAGKLGSAASSYGGGGLPLRPGAGAKSGVEESIVRTRLFAKLATILNKGTLSDADREIIDARIAEFRQAGLSEQQIMSRLAGFPEDVETPYNESFITLAAANTDTNEKQQVVMAKLGQMLASGDYTSAMETVERTAMQNVTSYGKENYVGIEDVAYTKKKVDSIEKLLGKGWSNEVGVFSGSVSLWVSNKFGRGDANKMKAQLGSLVAGMIQKRAGSAITDAEWKRLIEPNIPSMSDSGKTWVTKLDELVNDVTMRLNEERRTVSLPEITAEQATDPQKRLQLYAKSTPKGPQGGAIDDFLAAPVPSGASWDMAPDL